MHDKVIQILENFLHLTNETARQLQEIESQEAAFCSRQVSASKSTLLTSVANMYGVNLEARPLSVSPPVELRVAPEPIIAAPVVEASPAEVTTVPVPAAEPVVSKPPAPPSAPPFTKHK